MKISLKQAAVLKVIGDYIETNKFSPTIREICTLSGIKSTSTAHGYLKRLKERGLIAWESEKPRTLNVVNEGD